MVVIPQHRGILPVGIMADRRCSRHVPVLRIAIALRTSFRPMHVHHGSHFRFVSLSSVYAVVNGQKMFFRQLVHPLDQQTLTAARLKNRSRRTRSISPKASWLHVTVNFTFKLPHRDPVVRNLDRCILWTRTSPARRDYLQPRQRIDKLRELAGIQFSAKLRLGWM